MAKFEKGNQLGKKFQPGQSGNPGGAPKKPPHFKTECVRIVDEKVIAIWEDEVTLREREMVLPNGSVATIKALGKEYMKASELLAAYAHGKPRQQLEHTGPEGEALSVTVKFVKASDKR